MQFWPRIWIPYRPKYWFNPMLLQMAYAQILTIRTEKPTYYHGSLVCPHHIDGLKDSHTSAKGVVWEEICMKRSSIFSWALEWGMNRAP